MTASVWIAMAGGVAVLVVVFWPERQSWQTTEIKAAIEGRRLTAGRASSLAVPLAVFVLGSVYWSPLMGAALGVLTAVGAWALNIRARSIANLAEADQLAQLTAGLANQATVAPTVVEAVRESAPLVSGRVGEAARRMVEELRIGSLPEAADRFAAEVGRPMAAMTANVLIEAHSGGIKWATLVDVLDVEAGEAAETARHFYHSVGRLMVQVAVTLAMSVGLVVIMAMSAQSSREWLASGSGQAILLAAAAGLAVFHGWAFARAQSELR